ncbi:hypothetical protein L6452_41045 [Arctium lappa]|uniref:Uncharacterized protein n=1 Tax=Arctium lappa TaxID=4217 RepID=A0ACB8XNB2_ARCLA|nr:hypothetical protein L6452_41045 [Arctium lappa]
MLISQLSLYNCSISVDSNLVNFTREKIKHFSTVVIDMEVHADYCFAILPFCYSFPSTELVIELDIS